MSEDYTQVSVVWKSTKSSPHKEFSILQRPNIKYDTRTLDSMSLMVIPILQVCMASMFILLIAANQLKMWGFRGRAENWSAVSKDGGHSHRQKKVG